MTPEFWHARWERGETGWHEPEINTHLREYWPRLGVPAGAAVLAPLCGKTLDLLWLVGEGYRVVGVELSNIAVREFVAEHQLSASVSQLGPFSCWSVDELTLLCGDFFDLRADHLAQVVGGGVSAFYDRAALIAMPPQMRPAYARQLANVLTLDDVIEPGGLLVSIEYNQNDMQGPPFSVPAADVTELFAGPLVARELGAYDIWSESPRFQRRGLKALWERVWRLGRAGD